MAPPLQPRPPSAARLYPLLGLAALLLFSTLLSVHVINRDTVPLVADASGYYRTTLAVDRLIEQRRPGDAARRLMRGLRPPLAQLVTVAFYRVLGERSQRVARLSILLFLWVLLISTYGIGSRLKDAPTGLVAAVVLACFPQVIGYSRGYWMDLPLAAMTALGIWALLVTDGLRRRRPSLLLGLSAGLGLLTKYTFPIFFAAPALYLTLHGLRQARRTALPRREVRLRVENACLALLVSTALTAFWYMPTIGAAWRNFIFNQGAGMLWPRPAWTLDNLLLYARHLTVQLGLPLTALLLLTLPLFWRRASRSHRTLLLLWFGVPYLFFTYVVLGIDWARFTLPYLPAVALVLALGLNRPRGAAHVLCIAALLGHVLLTFTPAPPRPSGTFPWRRNQRLGPVTAQSFDFWPSIPRLFPPRHLGRTHVALAPDIGSLSSVLETLALEQGQQVRISAPYEPEAFGFRGRFRFPARVDNPQYLTAFDYLVLVQPPAGTHIVVRRPQLYRRFLRVWHEVQRRFVVHQRVAVPGGFTLLVHRNRRR